MTVLYHLTVPPSPMAACDAVVQEVEMLRARVNGEVCHLYPGRVPGTRFPRRWWGLQRLPYLRRAEERTTVHHVYNPDPYPFSLLRYLRRPIVYSVVAAVRFSDEANARRLARRAHTVVVSTEADLDRMRCWSIENVTVVHPGIEASRFSYSSLPTDHPPTVLVGSAPWTREQFRTKGVDALLELAQQMLELRLVFLWRGVLADEMNRRVRAARLERRVQVLNERVDVNRILARVHAAVVLAAGDAIIKAYPHSLLEALAAGRPVLVSRTVPMARYIENEGCGVVIDQVEADSIGVAVGKLLNKYPDYQQRALEVRARDFTLEKMLKDYSRIYGAVGL